MKPLAYWEEKTKRTSEALNKIEKAMRRLDERYRRGARRCRLFGFGAEHVRRRNRIFFSRRARLQRRKQMYLCHLLYYSTRMDAVKNQSRFDRALRQPPI